MPLRFLQAGAPSIEAMFAEQKTVEMVPIDVPRDIDYLANKRYLP